MPPGQHVRSHSPASLHPRELDRAVATLLGLDLIRVAVTGEQPGPSVSPASVGPTGDDRAGYHLAVQQQPNPTAEATPPPRVLIVMTRRRCAPRCVACWRTTACGHRRSHRRAPGGHHGRRRLQPDVVVMDVRMPASTASRQPTRLTGAHPNIRVVATRSPFLSRWPTD
jgi:hypothetical protein